MNKLTEYLVKDLISEAPEWWTDMSVGAQKDYISKYDTSKSLDASNPSGKKPRNQGKEATREQHSKAQESLSNRKGVDYHQTKNGGHVIGVHHRQDVSGEVDSLKKSFKSIL